MSGPDPTRKTICVVSPCFNEEAILGRFHEELARVLDGLEPRYETRIYYVDDGSVDGTLPLLEELARRDPRVHVYSFTRNFGQQAALSAGLEVARGDAYILMDSDLQHPPQVIPELVRRWEEGVDVVATVRRRTADAGPLKRWSSRGFYYLFNSLSDTRLEPGAADFVLLSARVQSVLKSLPERHRFIRGLVAWTGFTRALVPYDAPARQAGESKFVGSRMIAMALDATFSFSVRPLRICAALGGGFVLFGAVYFGYTLVHAFILRDTVPGWASLLCTVLILGGLQLFFMGVIGEYIARVFEQVKGRPPYLFRRIIAGGAESAGPVSQRGAP